MSSRFSWLEGALAEGLAEVFGLPIGMARRGPNPPALKESGEVVIATMGFASEMARGELTMIAARSTVRAIAPVELEDSDAAHCDVVAELTNVLLGWVKNGLLQRGALILLGIPSAVIVDRVRFPESRELATSSWHTLALSDEHEVVVRLEAAFDETIDVPPSSRVESIGAPGTMLFF